MAKKSSRASSPSWRTLRRQAAYAVSEAHKNKLIKEANRLRRQERHAAKRSASKKSKPVGLGAASSYRDLVTGKRKKFQKTGSKKRSARAGLKKPTRKTVKAVRALMAATPGLDGLVQGINRENRMGWQDVGNVNGDQMNAERIIKLARSKSGTVALDVQAELAQLARIAKFEGQKESDERSLANLRSVNEGHAINVVSSFLSVVEGIGKANGGPLPRSVMMSGFVIARVADALRKSGYTEDGFRPDRETVAETVNYNRRR